MFALACPEYLATEELARTCLCNRLFARLLDLESYLSQYGRAAAEPPNAPGTRNGPDLGNLAEIDHVACRGLNKIIPHADTHPIRLKITAKEL